MDQKEYPCNQCGKVFVSETRRDAHQETCGQKVECGKCGKTFAPTFITRHEKMCGLEKQAYQCPSCSKFFSRERDMRRHQQTSCRGPRTRPEPGKAAAAASAAAPKPAAKSEPKPARGDKDKDCTGRVVVEDPTRPDDDMIPEAEPAEAVRELYQDNWTAIRTHHHLDCPVQDCYNWRTDGSGWEEIEEQLWEMFGNQSSAFKINLSFGFVLRNRETGELRYYHTSAVEGRVLEEPRLVRNRQQMDEFLQAIRREDVLEWARQSRPDTKWVVVCITNVTVFVNKLPRHPLSMENTIGCIRDLPSYLLRCHHPLSA